MFGNQIPQQGVAQQASQVQLIKVSGLDGAKAFQMPANSSVALFHESEDLMYVKSTDGAGFPTIRTFRFTPYEEPTAEPVRYLTVEEFNKFKEELYGKQSLRTKKPAATNDTPAEE